MFIILSLLAVSLNYWLNLRVNQKMKYQQNCKTAFIKILKDSLGIFGLTFWALLFAVALFDLKELPPLTNTNGMLFKSPLNFLLKISALFLLFPSIFNLIKMFGELMLGKNWITVLINFAYNVMCEFGIFWAIVIAGFYIL